MEAHNRICTDCHTSTLVRIRRSRLMRLINKSKHLVCPYCHARYFALSQKLVLRIREGRHVSALYIKTT